MALQKQYLAKVFDSDGTTFLKSFVYGTNGTLKNIPTFQSRINGGYGECVLDLNLPFDDFDEGTSIDFMNIVRIYAVSVEDLTQSDTLIYTGLISRYEPYVEGSNQGVRVTLLGLVSILSFSFYEAGSLTVSHSSEDPEDIGRAIIDHVNSIYTGSYLSYSNDTTDAVGHTVSIDIEDAKWVEALQKVVDIAGTGWWWKIDEAGQYWLKPKPSVATHTFTLGKDVEALVAPKDSETVINESIVRWSSGQVVDVDATSRATFGLRSVIISATDLTDASSASKRAEKNTDDNKDERIKASITVNSQYDLESIKVGETCKLANYNLDSGFFNNNMQIVAVNYQGDTVRVDVGEEVANFGKEVASL